MVERVLFLAKDNPADSDFRFSDGGNLWVTDGTLDWDIASGRHQSGFFQGDIPGISAARWKSAVSCR